MSVRAAIEEIAATLDALLKVRYAEDSERAQRDVLTLGYLGNEVRRRTPGLVKSPSLADIVQAASVFSAADLDAIRCRCLFYGCDDLITLLVHRRIRADAIAREEAVLYVQDRLQRDEFRRIRSYSADRGASFVTYMWQVISNLLLDFGRAHGKHVARTRDDGSEIVERLEEPEPGSEAAVEARQLHEMLAHVMAERSDVAQLHPVHERLRAHLDLSSKERVFLKALFQYDLSMNEVRALPAFDMSVNEAYRFYYRIMEKLLDAFKAAGMLDSLRAQVSEAAPRVPMEINGEQAVVSADRIHYLEALNRGTTGCHADWQGTLAAGVIDDSFTKLSKRLAAYFTPIDPATAVADRVLLDKRAEWRDAGEFVIAGVRRPFRVAKRQLPALRERFAENSAARVRTNERASS